MAHFAEIDDNNLVIRVLVTDNNLPNEGKDWLETRLGGIWIQTSYNTHKGEHRQGGMPLRKNFAGIGYTFDQDRDAFIPPKPFESWVLDEQTCNWEAPMPYPQDDKTYKWDEEEVSWVEVVEETE